MDKENAVTAEQRGGSEYNYLRLLKPVPRPFEDKEAAKKWGEAGRPDFLWQRMSTQDYIFDDLTRGNQNYFLQSLFDPGSEHFELGDDGIATANFIVPKVNANIHFAVWGAVPVQTVMAAGKELLAYLFHKYELNRITAICPVSNKNAIRFATLLRFKYEGELRKAFLSYGTYYNTALYGLLREEFVRSEVVQ